MNANDINLAFSWGEDGTESAAAAVSIPENLHDFKGEEWYECINTSPNVSYAEVFHTNSGDERPNLQRAEGGKDEDRWNFIMSKLINIEKNTSNLTKNVNSLSSKVELQEGAIKGVVSVSASNKRDITDLYKKQEAMLAEVDQKVEAKLKLMQATLQTENAAFKDELMVQADDKIRQETREIKDEVLQAKCDARKINLLIVGIKEKEGENLKDVISSFFTKNMALSGIEIVSTYRLGKLGGNRPRLILVRFASMAHRQQVWFSKSKIKPDEEGGKIWIHEDLPKAAKHVQRSFFKVLKKAKSIEGRFEEAYIMGKSLYIDGKAYGEKDLELLPDVLRPSNMATLQSDTTVAFFGRFSPLSNHHPSPFSLDDRQFTCMEQFLAWSRATLAGDQSLISRALSKADPVVYKGILNDLHNTMPEEWKGQLDDTVLRGLRAKFQCNPALAHFLCSTHPKVIGEASLSKRWGIGFTLSHQEVLQSEKWLPEGNLLGRSLMVVRDELLLNKNV